MHSLAATIMLALSAIGCFILGVVVLLRNPARNTHRLFAVLTANLMLWAIGVTLIVHSSSETSAELWVKATFIVAAFLPATFHHFICNFPGKTFHGSKVSSVILYASAILLSMSVFTPWHVKSIEAFMDHPPQVKYGPVMYYYAGCIALAMFNAFPNLFKKLKRASGVERRQIQHVLLGIMLSTGLAVATNVLAPLVDRSSLQAFGPSFMVLMMGFFAYAMVRYQLLDIRVIVSRTTVYAFVTAFVALTFFLSVSLVHLVWASNANKLVPRLVSAIIAAVVIAIFLQPLKERVQHLLEKTLLKRHYDASRLFAQLSKRVANIVQFDTLLQTLAKELQESVGFATIRVLLVDQNDPQILITEYSSKEEEIGQRSREHKYLTSYFNVTPQPVVLEQLLHSRPTERSMKLAEYLAELDAYLCVPLHTKMGLVGILTLGQKSSRDIYTNDDVVLFTALAQPLATAIDNARLYRKLEELNLHLARILTNMRGGVVAVDKDGKISTINRSATDLLGPATLGQDLETFPQEVAQVLKQTLETQKAVNDFETVIERPNGELAPVIMSSSSLTSVGNGKTGGAMAMIYDLTHLKRLERHVQRADRLSSVGMLAAGMAHEIKNPLVSIKTFAQLLPTKFDDQDFRATFSEIVPQEVERIDGIVSRLLNFSRSKPIAFSSQNLKDIVEAVLALVDNQMNNESISAEIVFPEEKVEVLGDEQQLHQVFLNLVLNAIDAICQTESNKRVIRVEASYDQMYTRRHGSTPLLGAKCAHVSFSDTGCGIEAEDIERLFTPFYTTKTNGCGLGLAVVHSIITDHGGQIDVESTPGKGTSIKVTLPLSRVTSQV